MPSRSLATNGVSGAFVTLIAYYLTVTHPGLVIPGEVYAAGITAFMAAAHIAVEAYARRFPAK